MKFDMKNWKKIESTPEHTTLRNQMGHEMKVAHRPLSKDLRSQLESIPLHSDTPTAKLADGGAVDQDLMTSDDPQAARQAQGLQQLEAQGAEAVGKNMDAKVQKNREYGEKLKSGDINGAQDIASEQGNQLAMGTIAPETGPAVKMAKDVISKGPEAIEQVIKAWDATNMTPTHPAYQMLSKALNESKGVKYADGGQVNPKLAESKKSPRMLADGGDVSQPDAAPSQAPVTINIASPGAPTATSPQPTPQPSDNSPQVSQDAKPVTQNGIAVPADSPVNDQSYPPIPADPKLVSAQERVAAAPQPGQPSPPQASDPYGVATTQQAQLQGLAQQQAGILGTSQVDQAVAAAQTPIVQQQIQDEQKLMGLHHQQMQHMYNEFNNVEQDVKSQKLDFNRYLGNRSTEQKIGSAIGILISGLGSGPSGHNMAMDFINKQIDNDIEQQKADLGKKQNLLSANVQEYRNLADGVNVTRAMMANRFANQLQLQALKQGGPAAQARALQASGQLMQSVAPALGQTAMRRALLQANPSGDASTPAAIPPEFAIRALVPDPGQQDKYFKELQDAQNVMKTRDNVIDAYDKVAKLNTVANKVNPQAQQQIAALMNPVIAQVSKDTAGRFTEQDAGMIQSLFGSAIANQDTVAANRAALVKMMTQKANFPMLKSIGIDTSHFGAYDPLGRSKIKTYAPVAK